MEPTITELFEAGQAGKSAEQLKGEFLNLINSGKSFESASVEMGFSKYSDVKEFCCVVEEGVAEIDSKPQHVNDINFIQDVLGEKFTDYGYSIFLTTSQETGEIVGNVRICNAFEQDKAVFFVD